MPDVQLSPSWLREALGWAIHDLETVKAVPISLSGELMGRVFLVSVKDYVCVFKCPPGPESSWQDLVVTSGLVDREIQALRLLATADPEFAGIAPSCLWSRLTSEGSPGLMLEYIPQDVAVMVRFARGLHYDETAAALMTLGSLHSAWAQRGSNLADSPHPWLLTAESSDLIAAISAGHAELSRLIATCLPASFSAQRFLRIRDIDFAAVSWGAHPTGGLLSICHGDPWCGNVLFTCAEDGTLIARLVDWQFAMWGNPLTDVALLLVTSLEPEARRTWTADLLSVYYKALKPAERLDYSLASCRHDFQCALPFAVMVATAALDAYTFNVTPSLAAAVAARMSAAMDDTPTLFGPEIL